ncbi:MAG: ABC transporter permease [Streptosporangiales bacterium]|nr:ABC transporter permease [Streptosporangiales bacterium]
MTTATSAPEYPRAALPEARGRAGLAGAILSEWTKIRTVRSTYWTIFALAVISLGLAAGVSWGQATALKDPHRHIIAVDATATPLFMFLLLGPLVIAVLGALVITSEYSTGMVRTSLTVQPRRAVVYAAKLAVFAVLAFVVSIVIAFAAFFIGQSMLSSAGVSVTLSHPNTLRAIFGAALYVTAAGLLAYALGAILRHTAGAIALAAVILLVFQLMVGFLPTSWQNEVIRWLPTSSWQPLVSTHPSVNPHLFSIWPQFGVTAGWVVVLLIIGGVLFRTRDA